MINSFKGEHRWLSNFWPEIPGKLTVEHWYQAAKAWKPDEMLWVLSSKNAAEAKRRGRQISVRVEWDNVKVSVMEHFVLLKFLMDPDLADRLIKTGDIQLIEGNTWGDTFWGVCDGVGENNLGKILMRVRTFLQTKSILFPDSHSILYLLNELNDAHKSLVTRNTVHS